MASDEYRWPYYLFPIGSIEKTGTYKVRAIVDATNIIDTAFPFIDDYFRRTLKNNKRTYTFFVHGPDWIKVPDITGQYVHAQPLVSKPFKVVEIRRSSRTTASFPAIERQIPEAGGWVAPNDTDIIAFVRGKSLCNALIVSPRRDARWAQGTSQTIYWQSQSMGADCDCDLVQIRLMKDGEQVAMIADAIPNSGQYVWNVKRNKFDPGKYQIRIDSEKDAVSFIVQSFSMTRN